MATKTRAPFFKELSDAALVESYIGYKSLAHNEAAMRGPNLGTQLRYLDIIVGLARKRGLTLPV